MTLDEESEDLVMKKRKKRISISHIFIVLILSLGAIIMLLPFVWMVLTAFKTFPETTKLPIVWFPKEFMFDNFKKVLTTMNFGTYYKNSIIVTVSITVLQLIVCSLAAYGFARLEAPGKNVIFIIVVSMLMVPVQMTMIPSYIMLNKFGMINTYWVLIIPQIFSSYATFFLKQFFETLPKELEESARIDGCSYFRCYWNIVMPLCGTAISAFLIFTVLWAWNDMLWPLIMTSSEKLRVLPVGIAAMVGQKNTKTNEMMAASVLAILPMISLFVIFQKRFISGVSTTGLKG